MCLLPHNPLLPYHASRNNNSQKQPEESSDKHFCLAALREAQSQEKGKTRTQDEFDPLRPTDVISME
jgi:hypothetical protein